MAESGLWATEVSGKNYFAGGDRADGDSSLWKVCSVAGFFKGYVIFEGLSGH